MQPRDTTPPPPPDERGLRHLPSYLGEINFRAVQQSHHVVSVCPSLQGAGNGKNMVIFGALLHVFIIFILVLHGNVAFHLPPFTSPATKYDLVSGKRRYRGDQEEEGPGQRHKRKDEDIHIHIHAGVYLLCSCAKTLHTPRTTVPEMLSIFDTNSKSTRSLMMPSTVMADYRLAKRALCWKYRVSYS